MDHSRPGFTVSAPIVLVAILALALTVFLNVGKLGRTLGEVQESRLRFTMGELRTNLETGLDLGLTVQGLGNAQARLNAVLRQDPDIVSLAIVDTDGAVVYSSGAAMPPGVAGPLARHKTRDWLLREGGALTLGAKLSNNLGVTAGAIVLRYSTSKHEAAIDAIAQRLWLAALGAVLLTGLCFAYGVRKLVRRMDRTLEAMARSLGQAQAAPGSARHAAALVEQVNQTSSAALHAIEAARAAVQTGHAAPAAGQDKGKGKGEQNP